MTTSVLITALIARMGSVLFPAFALIAIVFDRGVTVIGTLVMLSIAAWIVNARLTAKLGIEAEDTPVMY